MSSNIVEHLFQNLHIYLLFIVNKYHISTRILVTLVVGRYTNLGYNK